MKPTYVAVILTAVAAIMLASAFNDIIIGNEERKYEKETPSDE